MSQVSSLPQVSFEVSCVFFFFYVRGDLVVYTFSTCQFIISVYLAYISRFLNSRINQVYIRQATSDDQFSTQKQFSNPNRTVHKSHIFKSKPQPTNRSRIILANRSPRNKLTAQKFQILHPRSSSSTIFSKHQSKRSKMSPWNENINNLSSAAVFKKLQNRLRIFAPSHRWIRSFYSLLGFLRQRFVKKHK